VCKYCAQDERRHTADYHVTWCVNSRRTEHFRFCVWRPCCLRVWRRSDAWRLCDSGQPAPGDWETARGQDDEVEPRAETSRVASLTHEAERQRTLHDTRRSRLCLTPGRRRSPPTETIHTNSEQWHCGNGLQGGNTVPFPRNFKLSENCISKVRNVKTKKFPFKGNSKAKLKFSTLILSPRFFLGNLQLFAGKLQLPVQNTFLTHVAADSKAKDA